MHLSAGFTVLLLFLVNITFVQSKPVSSDLDSLMVSIISHPSVQKFNNQIKDVTAKLVKTLSSSQLEALHNSALQIAQDCLDEKIDVQTAVDKLLSEVGKCVDPKSQLYKSIQTLVSQIVAAILPDLPNLGLNIGKRASNGHRTDLSDFMNQIQMGNLDLSTLYTMFPQYSDLMNTLFSVATDLQNELSPAELDLLYDLAFQLVQAVLNEQLDIPTAVNQLFNECAQYTDSNPELVASMKDLAPQVVAAILAILTESGVTIGKRK
ncbi:unnamed protein product [Adineta steineri]|uniref:Secreted protein n=1 Tax=Adineta steineri TaxID=433720 RepID=A0A813YI71_9BILA|nr:unnamed protein product [Adineta steineri]CAF3697855.1 unnamed protein product [Adineta steineri]